MTPSEKDFLEEACKLIAVLSGSDEAEWPKGIARALSAAYQRGREEARKETVDGFEEMGAKGYSIAAIAEAVRAISLPPRSDEAGERR